MKTEQHKNITAILGAGSWGTSVAIHIARGGFPVLLWGHTEKHVELMKKERENSRYLPGIRFPDSLDLSSNLDEVIEKADEIIIAVPSHAFTQLISKLPKNIKAISWLTKGVDPDSKQLLSERALEHWGPELEIAVITGPTFAKEVAANLPTALTIVSHSQKLQERLMKLLHHNNMRPYFSRDLIGAQLCGAVKNVLAIACGISDGLGFGANARAALITRGLAEMKRLGIALGADVTTFSGLAGMGDLVLTCTDNQSRNRRFGLMLGEGFTAQEAVDKIQQVVEGQHNASQVCDIAKKHQVDMPISQQVDAILKGKIAAAEATEQLMQRPTHEE